MTLEKIESLWFEEYVTKKIGVVIYPYTDENDEQVIGELAISTEQGVYDMSGNKILTMLPPTVKTEGDASISTVRARWNRRSPGT